MSDYNLSDRLGYIGLDRTAQAAIRTAAPVIDRELPGVLDAVYTQIRSNGKTRNLFTEPSRMDWAKQRQLEHWARIGQAEFDEHYASAVTKVGQ
ncbi:protoglobin domain-containing protein, partial [Nostoc sp. NIES-2111]